MRLRIDRRNIAIGVTALTVASLGAACGGAGSAIKTAPPQTTVITATKVATTPSAEASRAASPTVDAVSTAVAAAPTSTPGSEATLVVQATAAAEPTSAPPIATSTVAPPPPPPPPSSQSVTIVARDTKFLTTTLTLPAGAQISLTLDNQDTGTAHDIVIYDLGGGALGATDIEIGPVMSTVTFALGKPGNYAFKCSVHPQQMHGVIAAQ